MITALAVNSAWAASGLGAWRAMHRALDRPREAQEKVLRRVLGRSDSVTRFQRTVPIVGWDEIAPRVDAIRRGETRDLHGARVDRLVPTSGSTGGMKLIPWTALLRTQMQTALGAWIVDVFRAQPDLMAGPAYWGVSPALDVAVEAPVPVGLEGDSAYLGRFFAPLLSRVLAVPESLRSVRDADEHRYLTALHLLHARALRIVSVWHPSMLVLLMAEIARSWDGLVDDVRRGRVRTPDPRRADELRALGPRAPLCAFFPTLGMVSAWGDAAATRPFAELERAIAPVPIVPKGLLATEAFVTIPFAGAFPPALCSCFVELVDDRGRTHLVDESELHGEYEVVVTTGGGLRRYRLGDRVRVEGFVGRAPSLRFLGRTGGVDLVGEKLSEAFVASTLNDVHLPGGFAMLAPDRSGSRYVLFVDRPPRSPSDTIARLERALGRSPYFAHARRIGQLGPTSLFVVRGNAYARFTDTLARRGMPIGAIKPSALSPLVDWAERFDGSFVPLNSEKTCSAPSSRSFS